MEPVPSDIAQHSDYRSFLKDRYQAIRAANPRFSHRFIAQRAGARSAGWFADIVAGRQRLKPPQVPKLAAAFRLDARETEFLSAMVDYERADGPEARVAAMERWLTLRGMKKEKVEMDRFAFFEHWYHIALRELLAIRPFDGDYAALGAALRPPVPAARVRKAVDLLQRLGIVQPQVWNRRLGDMPTLVKAPAGETRHWNAILKAFARLALPALETYGKEERNFSALTLSLSPEGLAKAGEEIAQLRKRLLIIAEKDRAKNRVYQCLFQVFPLSAPVSQPMEASR